MNRRFPKVFSRFQAKAGTQFRSARILLALILLLACAAATVALSPTAQAASEQIFGNFQPARFLFQRQDVWQKVDQSAVSNLVAGMPDEFEAVRLNRDALVSVLAAAPQESQVPLGQSETVLPLPMPDGSFADFRIQEASVMMPEMAERFPEIKSYRILGVKDPTVSGRFDLTPQGFHAVILGGEAGMITILPADQTDAGLYASYADDGISAEKIKEMCAVAEDNLKGEKPLDTGNLAPQGPTGAQLKSYRIAIATTWEYSDKLGGGTTAGTVASVNTWLNGVNAIYEREVSIRLLLVNNTNAMYTADRGFNANSDPFTDAPPQRGASTTRTMLDEVVPVLRDQVGAPNYNLGHVLGDGSTQYAGVAGLGIVCDDRGANGPRKGAGVSKIVAPVGNGTSIDLFAHEIGHQFGADHTHNAAGNAACGDARAAESAYEVGGGISIMSYTGSCGNDALAPPFANRSIFHPRSIEQITNYTVNGTGAACPIVTNTGNNAPTVTAPAGINIPKNTPFTLTATANDPDAGDNNNLTYSWDQYQSGGANFPNPAFTDAGDPANTTRPIFRSYSPTTDPSRTFPSLQYILNNANNPPDSVPLPNTGNPPAMRRVGESLPQVGRTLVFRVTVRDNVGGVNDATTTLTVDGNSGPFRVTAPNTAITWAGGSNQTVTWDVANTQNAPVSAANVKISLSTDGGNSFPTTLAASVPNNGTANVAIPNGINTTTARIKVEAVGNIFFDISDVNFTITPGACPGITNINPTVAKVGDNIVITGAGFTGVTAVRFSNNVNAQFTVNSDTQITATVPAGAVGGAITVSKPGCNDSQSPDFTVCPGTLATLQVDSGQTTGAASGVFAGRTSFNVNRLTPASYPATLTRVSIRLPSAGFLPNGTQLNILSAANLNGGENINGVNLQRTAVTAPADRSNFVAFDVPPITISSGDFVVGYSYTAPQTVNTFGLLISTGAAQRRSYSSSGGTTWFIDAENNYMIRGETLTNCSASPGNTRCAVTITAPATQNVPGTGGNGTVAFTANQPNCPWTAARSHPWITFTSATAGTGNGTVNFTVAPNDTAVPRTGTITVNGQTFTINQAAGTPTNNCNYTLNPTVANLGAAANAGNTFAVAAGAGCQWAATTTDNWITITGGATGNGNGTVTYSLAANAATTARTGRITVAGQTFTVNQAGSAPVCNFALNPANTNIAAAASAGNTFNVAVAAGCQWTAATNDNWITITGNANGNGNGTVTFSVTANPSATNTRVGTITVGGQAFAVTQAPAVANCNYAVNPANAMLGAAASQNNTFGVNAAEGCQWTAATNDNWITITGNANGNGNGTVNFTVAANTGAARAGTITVQGQNFTVNQAAGNQPCTPITGGLVNWYRAENNVTDTIGGNNGTVGGTIAYAPGFPGQAMSFNGTDTVVTINRQVADNLTIEFWMQTQQNGAGDGTDWKAGVGLVGTTNDDFGVSLSQDGRVMFGVGNATIVSAAAVNDGFQYHVVATRNKDTGALTLYIDGGNGGPVTGAAGTQTLNGSAQLVMGRRGTAGAFYNGFLDEVKIYNIELSADQARAAFQGCANAQQPRAAANNAAVAEGDPNQNGAVNYATVLVTLSAPSTDDVAIDYETEDLTAIDGVDYDGVYGTLVIPAGQTSGTISIPLIPNTSDNPDRQFLVWLEDSVNATISDNEAVVTILDDDSACEFSLNPDNAVLSAAAGAGNTVGLSGASGCQWTATTADSWITITGGASGSGDGTVTYSVAANNGAARVGSIVVAGQIFTITQADIPAITGTVIYGTTPPADPTKYVAGVLMSATGTNSASNITTASGVYQLGNLTFNGQYVVTASKTGDVNGITAFDATLVLRCVAAGAGCLLNANQQTAADANSSGTISAFDATQILRYVAASGQTPNTGQTGSWKFTPAVRYYSPINASVSGETFTAILVGDVNGSWTPPAMFAAADNSGYQPFETTLIAPEHPSIVDFVAAENDRTIELIKPSREISAAEKTTFSSVVDRDAASVRISLPDNFSASSESIVSIPILLTNETGKRISAYSFAVLFDPRVLQPDESAIETAGSLSGNGFMIASDVNGGGRIGIAASAVAGAATASDSGTLLYLRFKVVGLQRKSRTALSFENAKLDDGEFADENGGSISATAERSFFAVRNRF